MTGALNGFGQDNVGQYVLSGSFSEINKNIQMIQEYQVSVLW